MDHDELLQRVATIREATGQRPRPVRVLEAVLGIADRGRDHLRAWDSVGSVVQGDTWLADLATPFFVLTAIAHIEAAALHAAKLTDKQRDSINVTYLLNTIEANKKQNLFCDDWPKVKGAIESGRHRLQGIEQTVTRIKEKRDRDLAHLDRRHINATRESQAIEVADLHQVFDAIDEIGRELAASSAAFAQVDRFSWGAVEDWVGPEGLQDLVYFARAGFHDELVKSPSPRAENIREFDRALRQAKAMQDGPPAGR
jgi:AbiU2